MKEDIKRLIFHPYLFSRAPRLYKRVCLTVGWSIGRSVGPFVRRSVGNAFVSAGREEPANDLFHVYELVFLVLIY